MRKLGIIVGALAAAFAASASAQAQTAAGWTRFDAEQVQLRGLAAVVQVTPEARSDIAVSIQNPQARVPTPTMRVSGSRVIIDGGIQRPDRQCRAGDDFAANVRGRWIGAAQMPVIEIRMPEDAVIASERSAAQIVVTAARSARLDMTGCVSADLLAVRDAAKLSMVGGDVRVRLRSARSAEVRIATAGAVTIGALSDGLAASIAGSGMIEAAHIDGPTNIAIQGSGAVRIDGGRAAPLSVVISGSGDVRHDGETTDVDAVVMGSGHVQVRRAEGRVSRRVLGAGEVSVGP